MNLWFIIIMDAITNIGLCESEYKGKNIFSFLIKTQNVE